MVITPLISRTHTPSLRYMYAHVRKTTSHYHHKSKGLLLAQTQAHSYRCSCQQCWHMFGCRGCLPDTHLHLWTDKRYASINRIKWLKQLLAIAVIKAAAENILQCHSCATVSQVNTHLRARAHPPLMMILRITYIHIPSTRKYVPIREFQACMGAYSEHYSSLGCYLMQRNKVCVCACVCDCNLAYSVTLTDTKVKLLSDLISNVAATGVATNSVVTSLVAEGNSN